MRALTSLPAFFLCFTLGATGLLHTERLRAEQTEPIPAFFAEYDVKYGVFTLGSSTLELSYPRPDRYRYQMFVAPQGIARTALGTDYTDTSEGRLTASGRPRPDYFLHEREGRDEKVEDIIFDRDAGKIHFDDGESIELQEHYVDRLLPQMLIMRDLMHSEDDELTYAIVDGGDVKEYTFKRMGREEIRVAAGRFEALRIKMRRDDDEESSAWVDPQRHNLPLKIEHIASGQTLVMELRSVSGDL
ncbi:DUF3108 domain-containing protein [Halorhodospira halochloris]|uniref:DUF3108 domain-containing protein n=1 Tax=Halorhodospira halochloris TaxID=1052 RepID=UPI001EE930FE|nr:DUF3108 domain-containing protein [Halorhodospira halochloris]MCG5531428.1 DUF3108 domain-containing protein [Halorhodospira halochloris]